MFKWSNISNYFFSDLKTYFEKLIQNKQLNHSYLFVGNLDLSLFRFAKEVSDNIIRFYLKDRKDASLILKQLENGHYPDLYILEREYNEKTKKLNKNISIEQVRALITSLSKKSFLNLPKIIIIKELDTLNVDSANALLKTLEEPAENTFFFLLTENIQNVLETIISRSQKIQFYPVDLYKIKDFLVENYSLNKQLADDLAHISSGLLERALFYLENKDDLEKYQDYIDKILLLFSLTIVERFNLLRELVAKNNDYNKQKQMADKFLELLEIVFRDMLLLKYSLENMLYLSFKSDFLKELSKKYTEAELLDFLEKILELKEDLSLNLNIYLSLENLIKTL